MPDHRVFLLASDHAELPDVIIARSASELLDGVLSFAISCQRWRPDEQQYVTVHGHYLTDGGDPAYGYIWAKADPRCLTFSLDTFSDFADLADQACGTWWEQAAQHGVQSEGIPEHLQWPVNMPPSS